MKNRRLLDWCLRIVNTDLAKAQVKLYREIAHDWVDIFSTIDPLNVAICAAFSKKEMLDPESAALIKKELETRQFRGMPIAEATALTVIKNLFDLNLRGWALGHWFEEDRSVDSILIGTLDPNNEPVIAFERLTGIQESVRKIFNDVLNEVVVIIESPFRILGSMDNGIFWTKETYDREGVVSAVACLRALAGLHTSDFGRCVDCGGWYYSKRKDKRFCSQRCLRRNQQKRRRVDPKKRELDNERQNKRYRQKKRALYPNAKVGRKNGTTD